MRFIFGIFILFFFVSSLNPFPGEIINNPIKTNKTSNPIDYKIIFQPDTIDRNNCYYSNCLDNNNTLSINTSKEFTKLFHDSFLISKNMFVCIDQSNNSFYCLKIIISN